MDPYQKFRKSIDADVDFAITFVDEYFGQAEYLDHPTKELIKAEAEEAKAQKTIVLQELLRVLFHYSAKEALENSDRNEGKKIE